MSSARVSAAVKSLAGKERAVVYDVAPDEAPTRESDLTPFVRGGRSWWRFVERRRAFDDGLDLNLIVSLRSLSDAERLLAVAWGTAFANSFLLVEPKRAAPSSELLESAPERELQSLLREAYAEWNFWLQEDDGSLTSHFARLPIDKSATLWTAVWDELPKRFEASDYLSVLTLLNLREAELFVGGREVAQAIVPFLTRIGLPVLYDARHVMQATRKLIDAGLASAQDPQDNLRMYRGPTQPLPADISDERLALMLR